MYNVKLEFLITAEISLGRPNKYEKGLGTEPWGTFFIDGLYFAFRYLMSISSPLFVFAQPADSIPPAPVEPCVNPFPEHHVNYTSDAQQQASAEQLQQLQVQVQFQRHSSSDVRF